MTGLRTFPLFPFLQDKKAIEMPSLKITCIFAQSEVEIDQYIGLAEISADIWVLPIYRYRP